MSPVRVLLLLIRGVLRDRAEFAAENLALRQQLAVLEGQSKRPRLRKRGRVFCLAFPVLGELAMGASDRTARNGCRLASPGIPALLAVEVSGKSRTA